MHAALTNKETYEWNQTSISYWPDQLSGRFPLSTKPVFSKNDCMGTVIQACFGDKKQFGSYFCNIKAG